MAPVLLAPWGRARRGAAAAGLRRTSLQMGYLKKGGDGSLLYSVVNAAEPDADGGWPARAAPRDRQPA